MNAGQPHLAPPAPHPAAAELEQVVCVECGFIGRAQPPHYRHERPGGGGECPYIPCTRAALDRLAAQRAATVTEPAPPGADRPATAAEILGVAEGLEARNEPDPGALAAAERRAAAVQLEAALRRYAAAQGVEPQRAVLHLAIANRLYDPDVLKRHGAPREIVKGLEAAHRRRFR